MTLATLGVIVTNRNFFADSLVVEGRKTILEVLNKMGIDTVIVNEEATPLGAVETWSDSQKCADLFKANQDKIEGILVTLPNFGNEKGVADALRLSGLNVPVLIHAFPDDIRELTAAGRRDAFCGKLSVTNNLYQYGIPFSLTEWHTIDPNSPMFEEEIRSFVSVCKVANGLRKARLGAVGARPNAFNTVRFSEKLFEAYGIDVSTVDLSEVFNWASKLADDDGRVLDKIEEVSSYARADKVPNRSLIRIAKLGVVLNDWMEENSINATALQCWESMQKNFGINACTLMSMMSDRLMPSACETDISGTVSMYALTLASGTPAALVDWNNNYNNDPNKCLFFHCGNWAKSLIPGAEIIQAEVLGTTLGTDNTWGALQGRPPAGPMTYARVDTDDRQGRIRAYLGEGFFTDDQLSTISGSHAVVEVQGLQELMRYVARNGFAHHCAMTGTHVADLIYEALGYYLGWDVYQHKG
jgi:L-fucose isomerase-like protein